MKDEELIEKCLPNPAEIMQGDIDHAFKIGHGFQKHSREARIATAKVAIKKAIPIIRAEAIKEGRRQVIRELQKLNTKGIVKVEFGGDRKLSFREFQKRHRPLTVSGKDWQALEKELGDK